MHGGFGHPLHGQDRMERVAFPMVSMLSVSFSYTLAHVFARLPAVRFAVRTLSPGDPGADRRRHPACCRPKEREGRSS
jgi:hypothetical protein